jgi:hypothetical protein
MPDESPLDEDLDAMGQEIRDWLRQFQDLSMLREIETTNPSVRQFVSAVYGLVSGLTHLYLADVEALFVLTQRWLAGDITDKDFSQEMARLMDVVLDSRRTPHL